MANSESSRIGRLKNRFRPPWIKALRKVSASRVRLALATRANGLAAANWNPLAPTKKSDTLFILGSGSSINDLRQSEWATIEQADSIGLNFWLLHDFVPNVFVFEFLKAHDSDFDLMFGNLRVRAGDYAKVPVLLKDGERFSRSFIRDFVGKIPLELRRNTALTWDWEVPGESSIEFERQLRWLDRFGLLTGRLWPAVRKRASVFFLVLLGVRAGYRRIVLCGVDLNNTDYFYDAKRIEFAAKGRFVPAPRPIAVAHKTNDPKYGDLTVSSALDVLDRAVLSERGIGLYVAFRSSGLFPRFPSFFGR
jgi:hypothetical protein